MPVPVLPSLPLPTPATPVPVATAPSGRHRAEAFLFAERPSRLALHSLATDALGPAARRPVRVNVWRNHAVEPVLALTPAYAAWAGLAIDWHLGPYDDTLQFGAAAEAHPAADVELVWLDLGRYGGAAETLPWFATRLEALRSRSAAPIVVATWTDDAARLQARADALPGVRFADLGAFADSHALPLLDARTAAAAGTPLAAALHAPLARSLVCRWLAACVLPPVKALALDLDETLHAGVLGEDGASGVRLTPAHAALQSALRGWRDRGVMLALVSRNEAADVRALFEARTDYPLRWNDFSATEVSWGAKSEALERIARRFNVATDAIVFVDDNAGELHAVGQALPATRSVLASADADLTRRVVDHLPGLWRWRVDATDALRVADLQANAQRESLRRANPDPGAYFRELRVTLDIAVDSPSQVDRLAELSGKTNQFNLALARLTPAAVAARMRSPDGHVAAVAMRDALADSGVIGLLVAHREDTTLVVDELCISCRAMGRGLEDAIVLATVQALPLWSGCGTLAFRAEVGPRNQPARDWLARVAAEPLAADAVNRFEPPAGLTILLEGSSR